MSRRAVESALRQEFAPIHQYAQGSGPGETLGNGPVIHQGAPGHGGQQAFSTPAFGNYHRDSHAAEQVRDLQEAMEAVTNAQGAQQGVQRHKELTDTEIGLIQQLKEEQKKKKWDQYWAAQWTPGQPWTQDAVKQVHPQLFDKQIEAIKEVTQFQFDKSILKTIGHQGDPHLAEIQYAIDQGQFTHMPEMVMIESYNFKPGPMSIWKMLDPAGLGTTDLDANGRYRDARLNLARTGLSTPNVGERTYIAPQTTDIYSMYAQGGRGVPPAPPPGGPVA